MLKAILTTKQENILKEERRWLADLQVLLAKLGATEEDHATLKQSIQQLDELFLLVVVGEFNAGKSAFINALLGCSFLKEGVTPTTTQVNILKFGQLSQRQVVEPRLHAIIEPIEILRYINIVDTPGTNAVIREHQTITEDFVPRSDMVIFITSADRPFTESERYFMAQIKDWGKKVVIVINKIDMFETEAELTQVSDFVRENGRLLLGAKVEIFPVSARLALKAKQGDPSQWVDSRFEPLEDFIHDTLDETERVRLKFRNPLGVGNHLLTKYLEMTNNRLSLLADDFEMLDNLENQLNLYRQDMGRDFRFRLSDIENVLHEMELRGDAFFDETMRLARVMDLLNKDRIQRQFEFEVVRDAPQMIEQKVNELIDWLVNADLNQWQAVMSHLEERKQQYKEQIVGDVGKGFRYNRERLIESVGKSAQRVVDTYDKSVEAEAIADGAQRAVTESAIIEVGAIGLGALVTALATTMAADVTGLLAAGVVAVLGLFIIPARRGAAKQSMTEKVAQLRFNLMKSLTTQFEKELGQSMQRITDAIAPYTRFVRAERAKLEETRSELLDSQQAHGRLLTEIEEL
jgi:small GTP-binding protein